MTLVPKEWTSQSAGQSKSGMRWALVARSQRDHQGCPKGKEICLLSQRAPLTIRTWAQTNGQLSQTGRWLCSFRVTLQTAILVSIETLWISGWSKLRIICYFRASTTPIAQRAPMFWPGLSSPNPPKFSANPTWDASDSRRSATQGCKTASSRVTRYQSRPETTFPSRIAPPSGRIITLTCPPRRKTPTCLCRKDGTSIFKDQSRAY